MLGYLTPKKYALANIGVKFEGKQDGWNPEMTQKLNNAR